MSTKLAKLTKLKENGKENLKYDHEYKRNYGANFKHRQFWMNISLYQNNEARIFNGINNINTKSNLNVCCKINAKGKLLRENKKICNMKIHKTMKFVYLINTFY